MKKTCAIIGVPFFAARCGVSSERAIRARLQVRLFLEELRVAEQIGRFIVCPFVSGWDVWAAQAAVQVAADSGALSIDGVRETASLAYLPFEGCLYGLPLEEQARIKAVLALCDEPVFVAEGEADHDMGVLYRRMIDTCDMVVFLYSSPKYNVTRRAYEYAKRQGKAIFRLSSTDGELRESSKA